MGSNSTPCFNAAPAALPAVIDVSSEGPRDAADVLASIGYEAADPSLLSPQWIETLQGLPDRQRRR